MWRWRKNKMEKYVEWIKTHAINPTGKCAEYTLAMQKDFPELTRVRGYYNCPLHGKRDHWWLVGPGGNIIDPTVNQFSTKGYAAEYILWDETSEEPTGRCLQCGDLTYRFKSFCSEDCIRKGRKIYG